MTSRVSSQSLARAADRITDHPRARWYDHHVPRFVFVGGPRNGVVDFRNLLPGEIPVGDSFYRLTNRTRNGIVEYLWQQPVTAPPPQPKKKRERKRATKPKI